MNDFLIADNLGPRKRKKRVRFGEEDSDQENQPPQSMPRTEGDSITAKAEAEMCAQPLGVLGSSLLLDSNFCPNTESPEAEEGVEPTSVEETQVGFASHIGQQLLCERYLHVLGLCTCFEL